VKILIVLGGLDDSLQVFGAFGPSEWITGLVVAVGPTQVSLHNQAVEALVLWHFDVTRLNADVVRAIAEQPKYGEKLEADGKLECRYHVVGSHGGAWIYKVASNEELDRLLAMSPVYNFATYQVLALAEMTDPYTIAGKNK